MANFVGQRVSQPWRTQIQVASTAHVRSTYTAKEDAFECPSCARACTTLISCDQRKKIMCNRCHDGHEKRSSAGLHQKELGVSKGKAWEIDNRVVSRDDGRTVINRLTGKPAQR